jgi:hypothetical protein
LFKSHASKKFLRPYLEENPQQKQDSGVTQVVRALTIKHEDLSSNSTAVKKKKKKKDCYMPVWKCCGPESRVLAFTGQGTAS